MESPFELLLRKYGTGAFITFALLGVFPLFAYECEANAPFFFALKYLFLPALAMGLYMFWFKTPSFRARMGDVKGTLWTALLAVLMTLSATGYVLLVNAIGPGQSNVMIQGVVYDLHVSHGRRVTSWYATIRTREGRAIRFELSRAHYERLQAGQPYAETWKVGTLGLLYR